MSSKVKVLNIGNVLKNINRTLTKEFIDKELLDGIGSFIIERIKAFTRGGRSIASGRPSRLKRLSASYIAMRQGAVKFRKTPDGALIVSQEPDERLEEVDSQFFEPGLSNLTFTGQMLRALGFSSNVGQKSVNIKVNDDRRKRLPGDGKRGPLTNAEVADYVAEQGRPFVGLDEQGIKRIKRDLIKKLNIELRKARLKR